MDIFSRIELIFPSGTSCLFISKDRDNCIKLLQQSSTYHRKEVVIALDFGGDLRKLLVKSIRDVMSRISGDDEDALSDSSKLNGQTTARQTIKSTLVLQMIHSKSFHYYGLRHEQIFNSDLYQSSKYN